MSANVVCRVNENILKVLRVCEDVNRKRTHGIEMYLEICPNHLDIFVSPHHDV